MTKIVAGQNLDSFLLLYSRQCLCLPLLYAASSKPFAERQFCLTSEIQGWLFFLKKLSGTFFKKLFCIFGASFHLHRWFDFENIVCSLLCTCISLHASDIHSHSFLLPKGGKTTAYRKQKTSYYIHISHWRGKSVWGFRKDTDSERKSQPQKNSVRSSWCQETKQKRIRCHLKHCSFHRINFSPRRANAAGRIGKRPVASLLCVLSSLSLGSEDSVDWHESLCK